MFEAPGLVEAEAAFVALRLDSGGRIASITTEEDAD